jgi:hypothetical protein
VRITGEAAGILRAAACMEGTAAAVNCRFSLSEEIYWDKVRNASLRT